MPRIHYDIGLALSEGTYGFGPTDYKAYQYSDSKVYLYSLQNIKKQANELKNYSQYQIKLDPELPIVDRFLKCRFNITYNHWKKPSFNSYFIIHDIYRFLDLLKPEYSIFYNYNKEYKFTYDYIAINTLYGTIKINNIDIFDQNNNYVESRTITPNDIYFPVEYISRYLLENSENSIEVEPKLKEHLMKFFSSYQCNILISNYKNTDCSKPLNIKRKVNSQRVG